MTTHEERLRMAADDLESEHPMVLQFYKLDETHPHIYEAFRDATLQLLSVGHRKFSHWMVGNYIRYNVFIETPEDAEYKIPNGLLAIWARQFILDYPEHDPFRIKALKHEV